MASHEADPPTGVGRGAQDAPFDQPPGPRTQFPPISLESAAPQSGEENDYLPEIFEAPAVAGPVTEAAGGVAWAHNDRASPCYSHLLIGPGDAVAAPKAFDIGKAELEFLIAANRYSPQGAGGLIAFGLRGAGRVPGRGVGGGAAALRGGRPEGRPEGNAAGQVELVHSP